jgi:hypothetical protein
LIDEVGAGLESAVSPTAAAEQITRLDTSPSAVDQVLAEAACEGFTSIANTGQLPDRGDWTRFMIGKVTGRLIRVDPYYLRNKVEGLTAATNAFGYNPQLAVWYARGCWLAGSRRR